MYFTGSVNVAQAPPAGRHRSELTLMRKTPTTTGRRAVNIELQRLGSELIDALQGSPHRTSLPIEHWARIVPHEFSLVPLSAAGSLRSFGGRFNAGVDRKHESVAKWVANGFLKAERIPNGPTMTTLIRVDDLINFLSRHVILAVMARECGTQSSDLAELIESQGCDVHSFQNETRRGKFGSIVAVEELGHLLREVCRTERFRG